MKRVFNILDSFLPVLPYLIVFIFSLYSPSDPDLGWHLKYGEYFWQHGTVLRDNTFSTMMPSYHWVNHSWGTDVLTYAVFHLGGFLGLTIAAALIITMTFFFFAKASQLSLWEETVLFPILLVLLDPINNISFRSQLLSLFLLSALFYVISLSQRKNQKLLLLVILLFLLWANIHGEFIFGLGIFILWMIFRIGFQLYQNNFKMNKEIFAQITFFLITFILSIVASLINPFGVGVYFESVRHFGNPMEKFIVEWLPLQQFTDLWWRQIVIGISIMFGIIFLGFSGKGKALFPSIALSSVLFFLPFWERRYAWPSYYLILPILQPLATFFKPDTKKITKRATVFLLAVLLGVAIWQRYPFTQFSSYNWNTYCLSQSLYCSPASAEYLIKHNLNHNIFSLYGWGGWLIWNYPQIKPTIDGRMSFWVDDKGYSGFKDYYWLEQNFNNIDTTKYNVVYMSPGKPLYDEMVSLVKEKKWKEVYKDQFAGIFVRKS